MQKFACTKSGETRHVMSLYGSAPDGISENNVRLCGWIWNMKDAVAKMKVAVFVIGAILGMRKSLKFQRK